MKLALSLTLAALVTLPLAAEEAKKTADQPKTADSPLVAAAKRGRANRAKKSIVITNETLRTSKGHVTTTTKVDAAPVIPEPVLGPEAKLLAEKKKNEAAAKALAAKEAEEKRIAEEKRAKAREGHANQIEEGLYEDGDPAAVEHTAEESQKPPM